MGPIETGFSRTARASQSEAQAYGRNAATDLNYEFPIVGRPQVRAVAIVIPAQDLPQQIDAITAGIPPQITTIPGPGLRIAVIKSSAALQALQNMARQLAYLNLDGTAPGTPSTIPFGALRTDAAGGTTSASWYSATPWPTDWIVAYDAYHPPGGFSLTGQLTAGGVMSPNLSSRPGAGLLLGPGEGAIVLAGHVFVYQPAVSGSLTAATRTETVLSLTTYGGAISQGQFSQSSASPNAGQDADVARALARYGMLIHPPPGKGGDK